MDPPHLLELVQSQAPAAAGSGSHLGRPCNPPQPESLKTNDAFQKHPPPSPIKAEATSAILLGKGDLIELYILYLNLYILSTILTEYFPETRACKRETTLSGFICLVTKSLPPEKKGPEGSYGRVTYLPTIAGCER